MDQNEHDRVHALCKNYDKVREPKTKKHMLGGL